MCQCEMKLSCMSQNIDIQHIFIPWMTQNSWTSWMSYCENWGVQGQYFRFFSWSHISMSYIYSLQNSKYWTIFEITSLKVAMEMVIFRQKWENIDIFHYLWPNASFLYKKWCYKAIIGPIVYMMFFMGRWISAKFKSTKIPKYRQKIGAAVSPSCPQFRPV